MIASFHNWGSIEGKGRLGCKGTHVLNGLVDVTEVMEELLPVPAGLVQDKDRQVPRAIRWKDMTLVWLLFHEGLKRT